MIRERNQNSIEFHWDNSGTSGRLWPAAYGAQAGYRRQMKNTIEKGRSDQTQRLDRGRIIAMVICRYLNSNRHRAIAKKTIPIPNRMPTSGSTWAKAAFSAITL